jgi:hypothetical protein
MARSAATGGTRLLTIDPRPLLASSHNPAISYFARHDLLGEEVGPVSTLWELPAARKIVRRQRSDGSWRYPGARPHVRSQENYDQLETFRQVAILVEKLACTREHPPLERAAGFLFSFQAPEGDFRGIYGNQYATTYVGAITELLVKAGYGEDERLARTFQWLLSARQEDGGWAIPLRTAGLPFSELIDAGRHPDAIEPDRSRPSSHLVTGMVLRAFAAHPAYRGRPEVLQAAELLASHLYRRDAYGDRGGVEYWERVSFPFWFTDVVSALDTLTRLGFGTDAGAIPTALERLRQLQRVDGTFALKLVRGADRDLEQWICLAVCRSLARWEGGGAAGSGD